jgi:hypothetical protein
MADLKIKLKDAVKKDFSLPTGAKHKITVIPPKVFVLDAEDAHFNEDRHVLLPDLADSDGSTPELDARRITGLGVIYAALVHAKKNSGQGLFVTGHTDAHGAASSNQTLSEDRAKSVSFILRGKRDDWRKLSAKTDAVDDYQTILTWQHQRAGWDCDPGDIDNKPGKATKDAVKAFQEAYNDQVDADKDAGKDSPYKAKIGTDGTVGPETWGAFYDLYMDDLMDLLELDAYADLQQMQAALKPPSGMPDFVGCGEHIPFNPARRAKVATESGEVDGPQHNPPDRRVEILFFDPGEEVDLVCHPKPGTCKPADCPVYIVAPHKEFPIDIPKGLGIAEVNLKLTFVDPEGKVRPFPEGLPVQAKFGDPVDDPEVAEPDPTASPILDDSDGLLPMPDDDSDADSSASDDDDDDDDADADDDEPESMEVDQEPTVTTGPDGVLQFTIPRKASSLYLRLLAGADKRFVTADPKSLTDQKLETLDDAVKAVGAGRVFFRLPTELNSRQAYFAAQDAPAGVTFKDGAFKNIDNKQTQVGSRESPLELRLGIKWQFFKFEYFDRWTSSVTNVPQPRSKKDDGTPQPPIIMNGFADLIEADKFDPPADSACAWDLVSGKNTVHCLPWLGQAIKKDDKSLRALPDDKCTARFKGRKLFVRTDGDGSSPDAARALVELPFDDPAVKTPGADRLRLYDLPPDWRSRAYPMRLDGETPDKARAFETISPTGSTADKPYVASLDVLVLQSTKNVGPDKDVQWNDGVLKNRFTIFDNQLKVYKPDPSSAEPYFTHLADLKPQPAGSVLLDVPPFTRLIARGHELFDVFDRRTTPFPPFKGAPVGARLAVRLDPGGGTSSVSTTLPMTLSAAPFAAARATGPSSSVDIGDSRTLILRCCGHDKNVELFAAFQYVSVTFDFNCALTAALKTKYSELKKAEPMGGPPANAVQLVRDCLTKIADRWNGQDGVNKAEATFEVDSPATSRGRYVAFLSHGDLASTDPLLPGDIRINLIKSGRSFMDGEKPLGFWKKDRMVPDDEDRFTGAHETGHIFSQPDEYLNTDNEPSYYMANIKESYRSSGTPYGIDADAMMVSNKEVRTRYFWDMVLFAHQNGHFPDAKTISVKHGARTFTTDLTTLQQSRVRFPVAHAENVDISPFGRCDLYAYSTGEDDFTLGTIGFVVVRVKMAWKVEVTDDFDTIWGYMLRASRGIHKKFNKNKPLFMNATLHARTGRVRIIFMPRFVCSTFPNPKGDGAHDYLEGIDDPPLPTPFTKDDYEHRANDSAKTLGVHFNVRLAPGSPGVLDTAKPNNALVRADASFLIFSNNRFDDDMFGTFNQMVGAPFTPTGTPIDFLTLATAMSVLAPELTNPTVLP